MRIPFHPLKTRLLAHLEQVARPRDPYWSPHEHKRVQHYIRQTWQIYGQVESHEFRYYDQTHHNLVLALPAGNSYGYPPIVIGAHYDAVPACPGADDNATGIAALLELAGFFATHPARHPIWLVAFDLEEYGLLGSQAYAQHLKRQQQPLRLMLSLEMLGYCNQSTGSQHYPHPLLQRLYPDQGNFIGLIGNLPTLPDLLHLQRSLQHVGIPCQWLPTWDRGRILADIRASDHAPFWDAGYRAVMVTDTAHLRNPHYHLSSDRIDTLDMDFFTGICQGIAQGLHDL
ncbi:MAG: M28 family peptidase [Cyanobacteriota bacterium]|nr:M28 family peptidase [Cyanobacteriota bacterium]